MFPFACTGPNVLGMKLISSLTLLSLFLLPACGDDAKAAGDATKNLMNTVGDVAKQTAAFDKLKGTFEGLKSTLAGITDGATAEQAKGKLSGMVDTLKEQMGSLGDMGKLSDSLSGVKDGLVKGIMGQLTGLMGNADIQKAIGPVLEKLKGVLGG